MKIADADFPEDRRVERRTVGVEQIEPVAAARDPGVDHEEILELLGGRVHLAGGAHRLGDILPLLLPDVAPGGHPVSGRLTRQSVVSEVIVGVHVQIVRPRGPEEDFVHRQRRTHTDHVVGSDQAFGDVPVGQPLGTQARPFGPGVRPRAVDHFEDALLVGGRVSGIVLLSRGRAAREEHAERGERRKPEPAPIAHMKEPPLYWRHRRKAPSPTERRQLTVFVTA